MRWGCSSKSFFLTTYGPQSYVFINPIFKCFLIHFLSTPSVNTFEACFIPLTLLTPGLKSEHERQSFCPHGVYDLSSLIICLLVYNYTDFLPFWILPAFIFCFVQFSILISYFLCRKVKIKAWCLRSNGVCDCELSPWNVSHANKLLNF